MKKEVIMEDKSVNPFTQTFDFNEYNSLMNQENNDNEVESKIQSLNLSPRSLDRKDKINHSNSKDQIERSKSTKKKTKKAFKQFEKKKSSESETSLKGISKSPISWNSILSSRKQRKRSKSDSTIELDKDMLDKMSKTAAKEEALRILSSNLERMYKKRDKLELFQFKKENKEMHEEIYAHLSEDLTKSKNLDDIHEYLLHKASSSGLPSAAKILMSSIGLSPEHIRLPFFIEMINRTTDYCSKDEASKKTPFREETPGISIFTEYLKRRFDKLSDTRGQFTQCALNAIDDCIEIHDEKERKEEMVLSFLSNLSALFQSHGNAPNDVRILIDCLLSNIKEKTACTQFTPEDLLLNIVLLRIIVPELTGLVAYIKKKEDPILQPIASDLMFLMINTQKIANDIDEYLNTNSTLDRKKIERCLNNIKEYLTQKPEPLATPDISAKSEESDVMEALKKDQEDDSRAMMEALSSSISMLHLGRRNTKNV